MSKDRPIYTLDLTAENCEVIAILNGFPVYNLEAKYKTNFSKPINSALIKNGNSLVITILPIKNNIENSVQSDINKKSVVVGAIKIYQPGEISSPEGGDSILPIIQSDKIGKYVFDNDFLSFRTTFLNSPKIDDKESLLKYANFLLKLMESKSITELLEEFRPKFVDMAVAYHKDFEVVFEGFGDFLRNTFFLQKPITEITTNQVILKPWCNERIWEIGVYPDKNLFLTEPDNEGEEYSIKIFVALVEGRLKVIR